ncbi:MAG TPA: transcriptional regulator, partial [Rhizobiales bacterium]|nr:transcriptional regulator [Hyphomicrobiales bacterium]
MQEILTARGFASLGNETRLAIFRLLVRAGE